VSIALSVGSVAELKELETKVQSGSPGEGVFQEFAEDTRARCDQAFQEIQKPMISFAHQVEERSNAGDLTSLERELLNGIGEFWDQVRVPLPKNSVDTTVVLSMDAIDQWSKRIESAQLTSLEIFYYWLEAIAQRLP
jgi:hypothetical protein